MLKMQLLPSQSSLWSFFVIKTTKVQLLNKLQGRMFKMQLLAKDISVQHYDSHWSLIYTSLSGHHCDPHWSLSVTCYSQVSIVIPTHPSLTCHCEVSIVIPTHPCQASIVIPLIPHLHITVMSALWSLT